VQLVDIVIVAVLALSAVVGTMYGFLNILFSLIGWAIALVLAVKFSGAVTPLLDGYIGMAMLRDVLAFVAVFVVSLALLTALGYFMVKLLGRTGLTAADRILGFVFGVGLGAAIVTVAVFLAGFTAASDAPWWQKSLLIDPFQRSAVWARQFLPDNVVEYHHYGAIGNTANP
jgi:membrane protein required for colicin V production